MTNIEKALNAIANGSSVRSASIKYSIPTSTLGRHSRDNGILSAQQKSIDKNGGQRSLARKLRRTGMSYSKIANQTGCNETSVKLMCSDIILSKKKD